MQSIPYIVSSNPAQTRCTTLCDKVYQWLATGYGFLRVSSTNNFNKTYGHDMIEILLKMAVNTINPFKSSQNNLVTLSKHCFFYHNVFNVLMITYKFGFLSSFLTKLWSSLTLLGHYKGQACVFRVLQVC